jgi:hypothetical protein
MKQSINYISLLKSIFIIPLLFQACSSNNNQEGSGKASSKSDSLTELFRGLSAKAEKINKEKIDTCVLFENYNTGEKVRFTQLVKNGKKLFFQYSELNCDICVDTALAYYKNFSSKRNLKDFIIVVESDNRRYIASFIRENGLQKYSVYYLKTLDFRRFYSIDPGSPFVYIADSPANISNAFIPAKEYPDRSSAYYKQVSRLPFFK